MQYLFQSYREDHSTSDGHLMDSLVVHSSFIASIVLGLCSIYFSRTARITPSNGHLMDSLLVHSCLSIPFSASLIEVRFGRLQTPLIEANLGLGNPPVIWIDGMGGYLGPYRASAKRIAVARSRALSLLRSACPSKGLCFRYLRAFLFSS